MLERAGPDAAAQAPVDPTESLVNVADAGAGDAAEEDVYPPELQARDAAACEILDGVPLRAEDDDVTVDVEAAGPVSGALQVHHVMTPGRFTTPDGKLNGDLSKTKWITHARVTLLRCRERSFDLRLFLSDGSLASYVRSEPVARVRLVPMRTAEVKGRLVCGGKALAGIFVESGGTAESDAPEQTDADGRFALLFRPHPGAEHAELSVMSNQWVIAGRAPAFELQPGSKIDLGDVELVTRPPIDPGLIGVVFDQGVPGELVVHDLFEGAPAQRAGIRAGDVVVEVDGVAVRGYEEARRRIAGKPGTVVRLKVRRDTEFLLFDITRQE